MNPAGYCSTLLLPAGILYFKATANQNKAWLQWRIANPELVKNFIIERFEYNGWENLYSLTANDQTDEYHFIDNNPMPGTNQYRLKIIGENNQIIYSTVQKIFIDINNKFDIYPNPTTRQLNITGDFSSLAMITLSDLSGKLIWQKKIGSSNNIIRMNLPSLTPGIYMIKINDSVKKLVIR